MHMGLERLVPRFAVCNLFQLGCAPSAVCVVVNYIFSFLILDVLICRALVGLSKLALWDDVMTAAFFRGAQIASCLFHSYACIRPSSETFCTCTGSKFLSHHSKLRKSQLTFNPQDRFGPSEQSRHQLD